MRGVSPTALLGGLIAIVIVTVGGVVTIFLAGGPPDVVIARAGLITAITGSVIASLVGLLVAGRAEATANGAAGTANSTKQALNGHADELEAAQARIAFLEGKMGVQPPPPTTQEQGHGQ